MLPEKAAYPPSLMPQRINRIKPCRLQGREISEHHTDRCGEEKGYADNLQIREKGDRHHLGEAEGQAQGQDFPEDAAEGREEH